MQIEIPLIGTLANMIGLFLSSLVSGLVGAIVLNLIDKFIKEKLKEESDKKIIDRKNEIINLQQKQVFVEENKVALSRQNTMSDISKNHATANKEMLQLLNTIFDKDNANDSINTDNISANQSDLDKMQRDLESLL